MQLTPAQLENFLQRLNGAWPMPRRCTVCGNTNWTVLDRVLELRDYQQGSLVVGGPLVPLVSVMCSTCGHTILFNALKVGVMEPQITPAPKKEGAAQ